jgi:hypothetical protein
MTRKAALKTKGPRVSETSVQRTLVQYLGWCCSPNIAWWHTPNGGKRDRISAAILKAMGTKAGVPDLMFIVRGRLHGLELKAEGGSLSSSQKAMRDEIEQAGGVWEAAKGLEAALRILAQWGVIDHGGIAAKRVDPPRPVPHAPAIPSPIPEVGSGQRSRVSAGGSRSKTRKAHQRPSLPAAALVE